MAETDPIEVLLRAREDLAVEKHGEKFIVNDPIKHTFNQLGVGEYLVFRCFDGASTVQQIANRMKQERDVIVSVESIIRLRDRLHEKQLLVAPDEEVIGADSPDAGRSVIQRLIMIDLRVAIKPDVFLTRLYHAIEGWVFRPAFFVCLFAASCIALQVWLSNWDDIRLQLSGLGIRDSLVIFYACTVLTIFVHEIGHGVATKGFGGSVPRMGAFLYFFIVVFYTDVSASWMFPSKFRRLMVLFAGAITNLAMWSVWTMVWRLTHADSLLNHISLAFMVINVVNLSFTLFPLLRGDGYYILSTALDIPNLSQSSHRYVRALLRRAFIDRATTLPKATNREALVYTWYSPAQSLFFCIFFVVIATRTAEWLVGSFGFMGFWVIALVVADRVARPLFRVFPGTLALVSESLRLGLRQGPLPQLALVARPLRDVARGVIRMWRVELVVAAPIVLLCLIHYPLHVSAPFQLISAGPVAVRPYTSGIIEDVCVQTGDWVEAGEVVAVLLDEDLVLQRQTVQASLEEARAKLAELEAGYRPELVAAAEHAAAAQVRATALALDELRRVRALYDQAITSGSELDAALHGHVSALARERQARTALARLRNGYRHEEIARERAAVRGIEQELAVIDQHLAWTRVRAHSAGRVVTPPQELRQRIGKHVAAGDAIVDIVSPADVVARIELPEKFMGEVEVGMPVGLRFFEDPAVEYATRVETIERRVSGHEQQRPATIGILSRFVPNDGIPPLGTRGIAKIDVDSRSLLGLAVARARNAAWVVFWSWW